MSSVALLAAAKGCASVTPAAGAYLIYKVQFF